MIQVESGLYMGSASDLRDVEALTRSGITHVLTVDSEAPAATGLHAEFVHALDDPSTDLLSRLDGCVRFIGDALSSSPSASVLVHCHAGRSRSACVVAAYLMKTHKLSAQDAYGTLRRIKPDVRMIEEFVEQLALYGAMGCELDPCSPLYKQFRLSKVTQKYPELQRLPEDVFAADPAQTQNAEAVYRCRKCRRSLFRHSSVLGHQLGGGASTFSHKRAGAAAPDPTRCTSHFIEPVRWMQDALLGVMDGQLLCPKCRSKLGCFNWCGERCSCGRWVTPAFQVHKSRVDEITGVRASAPPP